MVILVGILFSAIVFAADTNIGVVDMQKVLAGSTGLKAAAAQFQKQVVPEKSKLDAKDADLKKMMDQLKKNDAVMKPADKQQLQMNIVNVRQELMDMMQGVQQKAMVAQQNAMQDIQKKLDAIFPVFAKANHLKLIVMRDGILYSDSGANYTDYTDKVIAALNK